MNDTINLTVLAYNIKKYRKENKISQFQLAELLCVTPQAISKWERNLSTPDLNNVMRLSEIFQISTDELLGNLYSSNTVKAMIGIDCTGTESEFILFYENGKIIKRIADKGYNPNMIGMENTIQGLRSGIDSLFFGENVRISSVYAGVSGCIGNYTGLMTRKLKEVYPHLNIRVTYDAENIADSVGGVEKGIIVNCKSGCVVFAKEGKQTHRIGGWGYMFDDPASEYNLGRDAIRAVLAAQDGVGEETLLTTFIEKKLGGSVWENINMIYARERAYIAEFADFVFEAYKAGDHVAGRILMENYKRLAAYIRYAAEHYNCGNQVLLSGKIAEYQEITRSFFEDFLKPDMKIIIPDMPKVYGACRKCCELFGKIQMEFEQNFKDDYLKILGRREVRSHV